MHYLRADRLTKPIVVGVRVLLRLLPCDCSCIEAPGNLLHSPEEDDTEGASTRPEEEVEEQEEEVED